MEQKSIRSALFGAVFFGSIWGLVEASLGHALHYLPVQISGFIMFPIALIIMRTAIHTVEDIRVVYFMSIIAALIKLTDLFIPGLPWVKTINPALALLIEGTAVYLTADILSEGPGFIQLQRSFLLNIGWRAVFILFAAAIHIFTPARVTLVTGIKPVMTFLFINGLISTVLCWFVIRMNRLPNFKAFTANRLRWLPTLAALASSLLAQRVW